MIHIHTMKFQCRPKHKCRRQRNRRFAIDFTMAGILSLILSSPNSMNAYVFATPFVYSIDNNQNVANHA